MNLIDISEERIKLDKTLGYKYFIDYNCPLSGGNSGRVYLHRYVVSQYLGEWITSDEVVHHIDGDKLNNSIDNLELLSSSEHARLHMSTLTDKLCDCCGVLYRPKKSNQKFCSKNCVSASRIDPNLNITKEAIEYWVSNFSWLRASKELGLSDNGLRKRYKLLTGLDPKTIKRRITT